jgi:hypothetical protein
MKVGFILFLCSDQIHLINSFQNLIFITFLVKYSVSKLGNKAWETWNIRIRAMPYFWVWWWTWLPSRNWVFWRPGEVGLWNRGCRCFSQLCIQVLSERTGSRQGICMCCVSMVMSPYVIRNRSYAGFSRGWFSAFFRYICGKNGFVFDISNFCIWVLKKEILSTSRKTSDCGLILSIK